MRELNKNIWGKWKRNDFNVIPNSFPTPNNNSHIIHKLFKPAIVFLDLKMS